MKDKNEFIISAINDAQATIRAIDVKAGAFLASLFLPVPYLDKVLKYLNSINFPFPSNYFCYFFLFIWLLSIVSLARALSSIDNPSNHILGPNNCKGGYYGGGLFELGIIDSIFNRDQIMSKKNVINFSIDYPHDENQIREELTFEHMKLIYIRDMKNYRLGFSLKLVFINFIVLFILCVYEDFNSLWKN